MHPHRRRNLADGGDAGGVLAVVAVGEVEAEGGGAGFDQLLQPFRRLGGRADRGNDLGATHEIVLGHRGAMGKAETTIGPAWPVLTVDLKTYQQRSRETARYPDAGANPIYPTLGLCGEAGEVADKVKKVIRDRDGVFSPEVIAALQLELGDVLWYVAQLATELGLELEAVAQANLDKLASRAARNVIAGDGDLR